TGGNSPSPLYPWCCSSLPRGLEFCGGSRAPAFPRCILRQFSSPGRAETSCSTYMPQLASWHSFQLCVRYSDDASLRNGSGGSLCSPSGYFSPYSQCSCCRNGNLVFSLATLFSPYQLSACSQPPV